MNTFGFVLHHSWQEDRKSGIENFYAGLKSRIFLHKYHIEHTVALYQKEFDQAKEALKLSYEEPRKLANEKLNSLLGRYEDSQLDDHVAYVESGFQDLDNAQSYEDEQLHVQRAELFEFFNHSSVIQAYSVLEKGLKDICDVLKHDSGQIISQSDFATSRDYLSGYLKYLNLVIRLDVTRLDPFLNKIRDLQYIRNRFSHDRGEILKSEDKLADTLKKARSIVNASSGKVQLIEEDDVFRIVVRKSEYVLDFYHVVLSLFQEILYLIEEKCGFKILKNKLTRLLSSLKEPALFKIDSFKPASGNIQAFVEMNFINTIEPPNLHLTLKIDRPKSPRVYCTYSGQENQGLSKLCENLKKYEHVMPNEFYEYFIVRKEFSISLHLKEIESNPSVPIAAD